MVPYRGKQWQLAEQWPPIHRGNPKPQKAEQSVWAVSVLFLFFVLWVGLCVLVWRQVPPSLTPEQDMLFQELYAVRSGVFIAACDVEVDHARVARAVRDMALRQNREYYIQEWSPLEEALRKRDALRALLRAKLTADQTDRLDRQQRYLLASPWWC